MITLAAGRDDGHLQRRAGRVECVGVPRPQGLRGVLRGGPVLGDLCFELIVLLEGVRNAAVPEVVDRDLRRQGRMVAVVIAVPV